MPKGPAALTSQSVAPASVEDVAQDTFDLLNGSLTLQETGGTLTATGAEQTLYINNDPVSVFRPVVMLVDLDNMAGGDTTEFKVYYRIIDGGALQLYDYAQYVGADGGLANSRKLISITLGPSRFGVRVTLEQTAGVSRDYDWQVFVEA